jgi:hypothetical protein
MKQTGFDWGAESAQEQRRIEVEIDPDTKSRTIDLMASLMLEVLAAAKGGDDERSTEDHT